MSADKIPFTQNNVNSAHIANIVKAVGVASLSTLSTLIGENSVEKSLNGTSIGFSKKIAQQEDGNECDLLAILSRSSVSKEAT